MFSGQRQHNVNIEGELLLDKLGIRRIIAPIERRLTIVLRRLNVVAVILSVLLLVIDKGR